MLHNKRTRFLSIVLMLCTMIAVLSGCQRIKNSLDTFSQSKDFESNIGETFKSGDVDELYNLFSAEAKKDECLINRIRILMHYWNKLDLDDSQVKYISDAGSKKQESGVITYYECGFGFHRYRDKSGNPYEVLFYNVFIDKESPEREGIDSIYIVSSNTFVYSTVVDDKDIIDAKALLSDYDMRVMNVMDSLLAMRDDDNYKQADDEKRIELAKERLKSLNDEEMRVYGDSVIDQDSVEETKSDDSVNFYPALQFRFFDGSRFVIIVHNNP